MRTFILADNQFITGEGIISLIRKILPDVIIIRAKSKHELQVHLHSYPEAVVVLDYTLFDFVSMEQMLILKSASKRSSWLLFSDELGEHFLRHTLLNDPTLGVVMKGDSQKEITNALTSAINGLPYVCESAEEVLQGQPVEKMTSINLTQSEKAILHQIALGKTTKEIAKEKNLSFHTVNTHRKNIFRKLEINNVHEAVKYAIRAGILNAAEYYI